MKDTAQLLDVHIYGDDVLRKVAEPVTSFDDELQDYCNDLAFTMYERDGVGLASPQVGVSRRVFVYDPHYSRENLPPSPIFVINPEILSKSGEIAGDEGCISIPDIYAEVTRAKDITVKYQDLAGTEHTEELSGFEAVVFQHEYDHLNGVLFTDHVSSLTKLKLTRKLKLMASKAVNGVNLRVFEGED
ncbi:MAG: peptide deformylase [Candidatus Cloacimonadota bacterium]